MSRAPELLRVLEPDRNYAPQFARWRLELQQEVTAGFVTGGSVRTRVLFVGPVTIDNVFGSGTAEALAEPLDVDLVDTWLLNSRLQNGVRTTASTPLTRRPNAGLDAMRVASWREAP